MTTSTTTLADRARANIRLLLEARDMSIAELGRAVWPGNPAVAASNMRSMMSGGREPSFGLLERIASALGVDVAALTVPPRNEPVDPELDVVGSRAKALFDLIDGGDPWEELDDDDQRPYIVVATQFELELASARVRDV